MLKRNLIAPLTLVAVLAMAPAASALNFVEAFTAGSDTVLNDWNDGNNGWVIPLEAHPNRATTDGTTGGTGRIFNNAAGTPITVAQQPALALRDGSIFYDFADGTSRTDLQLVLEDSGGTEALRLFAATSSSNLTLSSTGTANIVTAADAITTQSACCNFANITVDFDAATDMITVDAISDNGNALPNPITFPMDNAVNEVATIRWEVHENGGSVDWNLRLITIDGTDVPEPASLALLGMGGLCFLRRRRAA